MSNSFTVGDIVEVADEQWNRAAVRIIRTLDGPELYLCQQISSIDGGLTGVQFTASGSALIAVRPDVLSDYPITA